MHSYVCVPGGYSMLIFKSFPLRNFQMSPSPRNVEFSCKTSMIELIIFRFTGLMFSVSLEIYPFLDISLKRIEIVKIQLSEVL